VLQMVDVDSWSMHVRSITGHAELQVAVREFERNVERAVQMDQTPVKVQPLSCSHVLLDVSAHALGKYMLECCVECDVDVRAWCSCDFDATPWCSRVRG
jgi:hypothetical protein